MTAEARALIDRLERTQTLTRPELATLLADDSPETAAYLFRRARAVREEHYGNAVFIRGLIEFTNYCRNDCFYCGIRRKNGRADRYRLTEAQILDCCALGYTLGFRTFVLQGGEDMWFDDRRLCGLVSRIKAAHPDCAVTLSVGERSRESYRALRGAGADRYLLRHETASPGHYAKLHPAPLTLENRLRCLYDLKEAGFQVGCGFMVGSPHQTDENIIDDLLFLGEFQPQMVGLGPFLPHHDTPFAVYPPGSQARTLFLLGIVRLLLPRVLLPATTALETAAPGGRERGILAGANVVMPNLSPAGVREKYLLYDNKAHSGDEAAEAVASLRQRMAAIGCTLAVDRGDPAV